MLTNDLSNNNTPSSAPPPPPPLPPADWGKNWKPAKNNDKNENTLGSTPSKTSNSTQLKRGPSGISNPTLLEELEKKLKSRKAQKENNVDSETADEGSKNSIHVKNSETRNSAQSKEEDNASDKTKNDRSNAKQGVPKKPMTEQHSGVQFDKDKLGKMKCESKNQKSSLAEQKKATALKYSIAILLLFTSGAVAGVCTYFVISAVLSGVAVPVLFAVIASVSALVMLSSAVYLINPHLSAINSEKGVDPGRKQSQDLQKAKELEHSNTHTSSPPVALRTSSVPTPPTLKNNTTNKSIPSGGGKQQESGDLMADLAKNLKSRRKATDEEDDVQQRKYSDLQKAKGLEHSNTPIPSLVMSETPSTPPPPPPSSTPVKSNDLSTAQRVIRKSSPSDANQKDVQQKQSGTPVDARSNLLAEIRNGLTLKKVSDEQKNHPFKDNLKIPQKQEEESTPEKQENGVQPLNNGVYQIRKVESQKTDKEPSNSEGMQQKDSMNSLKREVLERRRKNSFQDEQLDSLDGQYDSFFSLEEEQCKAVKKEQENCTRNPDAALLILSNIPLSKFSPLESPINNLSSNSANVLDDEDWETQPNSMPYIPDKTKQEKINDMYNHNCSASSSTQVNNVEPASSDMQDPSTVSVKDRLKIFEP